MMKPYGAQMMVKKNRSEQNETRCGFDVTEPIGGLIQFAAPHPRFRQAALCVRRRRNRSRKDIIISNLLLPTHSRVARCDGWTRTRAPEPRSQRTPISPHRPQERVHSSYHSASLIISERRAARSAAAAHAQIARDDEQPWSSSAAARQRR